MATLDFESRIFYLVSVPDWEPHAATPLQGFAPSLCENTFLIRIASLLPSSIFDLAAPTSEHFLARRLCGVDPINWFGQSPRAMMSIPLPWQTPFTVTLLGEDEDPTPFVKWAKGSPTPPVIVAKAGGDLRYSEATLENLQRRFLETCDKLERHVSADQVALVRTAIANWTPRAGRKLGYTVGGHGTVTPNLYVLHTMGFDDYGGEAFNNHGAGNQRYVDPIVRTAQSILEERASIPTAPLEASYPRGPGINLFSPAMYPEAAGLALNASLSDESRKAGRMALQMLEQQKGYSYEIRNNAYHSVWTGRPAGQFPDKGESVSPHPFLRVRQMELRLCVEAMATLAASEMSATLRLPNEVNRAIGTVRQFASHYRGANAGPRKRLFGFREVQNRLAGAVPIEFIQLIRESNEDVRIVSNAHLEWLNVDGLPLSIRRNVSRVPVTPGNLFIDQVGPKAPLRLLPRHFRKILVVGALRADDPIKRHFEIAFDAFSDSWRNKIDLTFAEVSSTQEFVDALNSFHGPMMIFDGHGAHHPDQPAVLRFQDEECDVWQLQGQVRVPPIVMLSACDTHAADRNHATTANGFLHLGARSVLSSVFPLESPPAAAFAARLVWRIASYIPSAIKMFERSLSWTEIVSGMLRMQLMTDYLRRLADLQLLDEKSYGEVHLEGNLAINAGSDDPFAHVIDVLKEKSLDEAILRRELEIAVATSSVLAYLNVGRPETIFLDADERLDQARGELGLAES